MAIAFGVDLVRRRAGKWAGGLVATPPTVS
jgi:hypothetical protein